MNIIINRLCPNMRGNRECKKKTYLYNTCSKTHHEYVWNMVVPSFLIFNSEMATETWANYKSMMLNVTNGLLSKTDNLSTQRKYKATGLLKLHTKYFWINKSYTLNISLTSEQGTILHSSNQSFSTVHCNDFKCVAWYIDSAR